MRGGVDSFLVRKDEALTQQPIVNFVMQAARRLVSRCPRSTGRGQLSSVGSLTMKRDSVFVRLIARRLMLTEGGRGCDDLAPLPTIGMAQAQRKAGPASANGAIRALDEVILSPRTCQARLSGTTSRHNNRSNRDYPTEALHIDTTS
jgi:hypothetical protein